MIFYLKEKNKKIVELNVDVTLDHFKIVDYEVLTNTLPNIFENLNGNNKAFGLMILNNFINNRIYLPERFITDVIKNIKYYIIENNHIVNIDFKKSPHFVNIANDFLSFTDNFSIITHENFLHHSGGNGIYDVYNLPTSYITVKRDDGIYQQIFESQENKNKVINYFKEFYNEKYSNFLKFDDSACCRVGFKFDKNVQFISIADLLIDYNPKSENPFLEIQNQNIHLENKILKLYGEKALQAFNEKRFLIFFYDFVLDFGRYFLLKKKDDFIFFKFF